jgi:hypothetical protein
VLEIGGWKLRKELDSEESWKRPRCTLVPLRMVVVVVVVMSVIIVLHIFSAYRTKNTALPLQ